MPESTTSSVPSARQPVRQHEAERVLCLTNIRSFQQKAEIKERIRQTKSYLRGRSFKTKDHPPRFCKSNKYALLKLKNKKINEIFIGHLSCKSWTCPKCQLTKALTVKYYLRDLILLNDLSYFVTLTLNPKTIPYEYLNPFFNNTHKYITKIFNHFNTILKRHIKTKVKLKYVWVVEFQGNGNAHMHLLYNQFLPRKKIKSLWVHVGGGHQLWIENIKSKEAVSHYITDYIVKGIKKESEGGFKFFERRYSYSRNCIKPEKQQLTKKNFTNFDDLEKVTHKIKAPWIADEIRDISRADLRATIDEGNVFKFERAEDDSN